MSLAPILAQRQAGHCPRVVTDWNTPNATGNAALRCWADGRSVLTREVATECQSLADPKSPLGLCSRHQAEIVG